MNSQQIMDLIHSELLRICEKHTPKKKQRRQNRSIIPRDRRILMKSRAKLIKRMATNQRGNDRLRQRLRDIEVQLTISQEYELQREEQKAISAIRQNPKYFYRYASSKAKFRTRIGPMKVNDELITEPKQIADALNDQYKSVFSHREQAEQPNEEESDTLEDINFGQSDMEKSISEISIYAAAGPDNIPAILLKCAKALSLSLLLLWRQSLDTGEIPSILKHGIISPIYKGGSRLHPKNYRPVGLTSHIIKTFERIIVKQLSNFLESNSLHNEHQHGFRQGRSCLSQLLQHHIEILKHLESGHSIDVIYLDFKHY